jgi:hypothetical protein
MSIVALLTLAVAIQFEFAADEIFIPVRVNGSKALWFALDSASSSMILDPARARELGIAGGEQGQGRGAGAGAVAYTKLTEPVSLQIGPLPTAAYSMITIDLSGPAKGASHAMDGILGYEFFSRFVIAIDYQRHRMTITAPDEFRAPRGYVSLPLRIDHKLPFVDAELKVRGVPPATGGFLIDSGSADAVDHPLIKQSTGEVRKTVTGVGLGEPTTGYVGRAEYFKLGPYVIKRPVLACCGGNEFNQQMIGAGILEHFRVIFDYPHSRLYIRRR